MFIHISTEANLFNGINLLSCRIVKNAFFQSRGNNSQKVPFLTMWLLITGERVPPSHVGRQNPQPNPRRRSLPQFSFFSFSSTACPPGGDPRDTQGSLPLENLGTPTLKEVLVLSGPEACTSSFPKQNPLNFS